MLVRLSFRRGLSRLASRFAMAVLVGFGMAGLDSAGFSQAAEIDGLDATAKKVAAHIEAGEFGPARVLAQAVDPAARDALMAQIAAGQMRFGARRGGVNTLGMIGDDRVRTGAFQSGGSPFAGGQPGFGFVPRGGAMFADFQPLIDLIQNTTGKPEPGWIDDGGVGTVEQFPMGVLVDAGGLLAKGAFTKSDPELTATRKKALFSSGNLEVRNASKLRKVSLTRLEKQAQLRRALGLPPDEAMRNLAGLQKINYVLVYPETGDIVVAGPAGDWARNGEGRSVSTDNGRPVLQLDDFVVLLRSAYEGDGVFGCSINPREENLAKAKAFLDQSSKQPIKPTQREAWVRQLRDTVGRQDIKVFGVDSRTRVAQVLVEADYRMKLIGMGLEESVLGVDSYLDTVKPGPDGSIPPIDVLRWWFTINYDALQATKERDAFEIRGQGVKVLSENELLTQRGDRIHTGKSDELNSRFAESFTKHFGTLSAKYPIYAELQNIFDLALVAALVRSEDLAGQTGWHRTYFGDDRLYDIELGVAPKEVESVVNHRVVNRKNIVVGVSGGVSVDMRGMVKSDRIKTDDYGLLKANHAGSQPKPTTNDSWWWD